MKYPRFQNLQAQIVTKKPTTTTSVITLATIPNLFLLLRF